jgi:hypothetical protein
LAGAENIFKRKGLQTIDNVLPPPPEELIFNPNSINISREQRAIKVPKRPIYIEEEIGNDLVRMTPNRGGSTNNGLVQRIKNINNNEYVELLNNTDVNGNKFYSFSANMPSSPIKAGRSMKELESLIPKGSDVLETNSLSNDSFNSMLSRAKNPDKYKLFANDRYMPMNNSAKKTVIK